MGKDKATQLVGVWSRFGQQTKPQQLKLDLLPLFSFSRLMLVFIKRTKLAVASKIPHKLEFKEKIKFEGKLWEAASGVHLSCGKLVLGCT